MITQTFRIPRPGAVGWLFLWAGAANGAAQEDLIELPLDQLLNIEVSVGTKTENKPLRETPGIVTVITGEEIANTGARDLIDVLRLVPGFSFGLDVYEVTGPGLRGNWAYEGKVLLLVDGIEMNERQYGNLPLGSHYPLHNIQRIEIIRGPGSVNYGGFAELGVINIITKEAKEQDGAQIGLNYGQMERGWGRRTADFLYGGRLDNGMELAASAYAGETHRSDQEYVSPNGLRQDMRESSHLYPMFVNLGLRYGNFSSRLLLDNYRTTYRNRYGEVEDLTWRVDFESLSYQAKYLQQFSEDLSLDWEGGYTHETAWHEDMDDPELAWKGVIQHYWAKAGLKYRASDKLKMAAGLELSWDQGDEESLVPVRSLPDAHNYAVYAEGDYSAPWGNVTVGLRHDRHSLAGSHSAPRVALTRVLGEFHYKLLYSHAFRTPAAANLSYQPGLKPESSKSLEAEVGYQFSQEMGLVVNLFDNKIADTIMYGVEPLSQESNYFNTNYTGTRGMETEFRLKRRGYTLTLNHAYYRVAHGVAENQKVINFQNSTTDDDVILGLPAHKVTLNAHWQFAPQWSFNPSVIWNGARYGYTALDEAGNPVLSKFGASWLVNLFFRYQPASAKNLELGFGVYDLLGENPVFIQPYNGGSAPLPGPSREWLARLRYRF